LICWYNIIPNKLFKNVFQWNDKELAKILKNNPEQKKDKLYWSIEQVYICDIIGRQAYQRRIWVWQIVLLENPKTQTYKSENLVIGLSMSLQTISEHVLKNKVREGSFSAEINKDPYLWIYTNNYSRCF
jgi:hypothetical protein